MIFLSAILLLHLGTCWPQGVGWGRLVWKTVLSFWNTPIFVRSLVSYTWTWREFGWLEILCVHFSALAFLLSHCLMTVVQGDCIDFTGFGTVTTGRNVVSVPMGRTKHRTPLERELEAVEGISLHQFNQPVAEVVGRVSVVTPTTASRARFHPQLWQCFLDQTWADKELVVVETYHHEPSSFFQSIARVDSRLRYFAIKRPVGEDLTVGAKRNIRFLFAPTVRSSPEYDHFVGQWSVLREFWWWWWSICRQVCGVHGDCHATAKLGRPDTIRLAQFLRRSRLGRIFGTQIMDPMIWVPNEEELDDLAVSDCRAFEGFMQNMQNYSTSFTWFTGIFTSLFEFWSCCWVMLKRQANMRVRPMISHYFTWFHQFQISPWVLQFHHVH